MTHAERLTAARAFRKNVLAERDSLREQLAEKTRALAETSGILESLRALAEMTHWAELSSGATMKEGARVRYFGRTYICIKDHTKALTRSPSNEEYWREEAEQWNTRE